MSTSPDTTTYSHALRRNSRIPKFYSTPIVGRAPSSSSISVSAIDTNSSSSTKGKFKQKERRKRKKFQEERSSGMSKTKKFRKKMDGMTSSEKKRTIRNEKQQKKREKEKETRLRDARESEYEWETYDMSSGQSSERQILLFDDYASPEHIRRACSNTDFLYSPIFLPPISPTEIADSPKRIIADEELRRLHVKDLALSVGFSDSDEEEEYGLILNWESNVRVYPPQKKERAKKKNVGIDKSKAWLVDVAIPTVSSDLLWNDYVEKNYEKVSKYLARPGHDKRNSAQSSTNNSVQYINNTKGDLLGLTKNWSEETNLRLSKLRKNMNVTKGYYDKSSRTFANVEDVYDFPKSEDNELFKDGGTKMTLHQYRQKRRMENRNVESDLISSSPVFQPDVEKTFRTSRHARNNGKMKMKMKKPKTTMADVSRLELQRISDIRKFASRLKAKKEAMISNETSLCSTSKNHKPSCTVPTLKRTYKDDIEGKQVKNKRLRSTKQISVPNIKSIETLRTVRYERDKQNWRII